VAHGESRACQGWRLLGCSTAHKPKLRGADVDLKRMRFPLDFDFPQDPKSLVSPLTGITRRDWENVADDLLNGSAKYQVSSNRWDYAFPGRGSVNGTEVDSMESFARLTLLASFRSRHLGSSVPAPWLDRLLEGLEEAAISLHCEAPAFPSLHRTSQALVESASFAIAFAASPERLWHPLSENAKASFVSWFEGALVEKHLLNNWVFFPAAVASFLETLGLASPSTERALTKALSSTADWHRSKGWYSDGPIGRLDYYSAWSYNYYIPLLAHLGVGSTRSGWEAAARRSTEFLDSFLGLIDTQGAPVYFGRSLTYRFGLTAPIWTSEIVRHDHTVQYSGFLRAKASQTLKYFLDRRAIVDGRLVQGWHGEDPSVLQAYSGPGSQLWAAKGFVGLLMDSNAQIWASPEREKMPERAREAPVVVSAGANTFMISSNGSDVARISSAGIFGSEYWVPKFRNLDPNYARFAFTSISAPSTDPTVPDNWLWATKKKRQGVLTQPVMTSHGVDWISANGRFHRIAPHSWPHKRFFANYTRHLSILEPRAWRRGYCRTLVLAHDDVDVRIHELSGLPKDTRIFASGFVDRDREASEDDREIYSEFIGVIGTEQPRKTPLAGGDSRVFGRALSVDTAASSMKDKPHLMAVAIRLARKPHAIPLSKRVRIEPASSGKLSLRIDDYAWTIDLSGPMLTASANQTSETRQGPA
jgi:hypothetical protein